MDGIRPLNWSPGTTLALMVVLPEGGLIGFDGEASRLEELTDDQGTDLLAGEAMGQTGFGMMPAFSGDREACIIEVSGPGVSDREARQVNASGVMIFTTASSREAFRHEGLVLQEGAQLEAGPIPFGVAKVGPPDWGDAAMQVTLEAKQDCSAVADIQFTDEAGRPIEAQAAGTATMSVFGKVTVQKAFSFDRKVERATVTIAYWTDLAKREVPFSVSASVGL